MATGYRCADVCDTAAVDPARALSALHVHELCICWHGSHVFEVEIFDGNAFRVTSSLELDSTLR